MVWKLLAICITVLIIAILQLNVRGENEAPIKGDNSQINSDQNKQDDIQENSLKAYNPEEISPSNENIIDTGQTIQESLDNSNDDEITSELSSESTIVYSDANESPVGPTETDSGVSESLEASQSDVTLESSQEQITPADTQQTVGLDTSQNISSETPINDATPVLDKDTSITATDSIEPVTLDSNIATDPGEAPSPTPISAPPEKSVDSTGQDDPESGKQDEDFPSFAEWTQKVLAEQEKTKQESQTTTGKASQQSPNQKKLRNNYAAKACGGKVLAANPEAENINYLLTTNKDEYMINPCSSKKWFVIELCEPVQVKMLELASLELFSSQPKSFRVSLSDRYPAKEWIPLGLYEATDERSVQSFQALNDQFVKYVKVELIEHYGNEHFCPLTMFRLYGVPITDDDDNDENENNSNNEADLDNAVTDEEESKDGAKNLFMSAKDTVVNLVKKVLNVNKDTGQIDTNKTDSGTDASLNISADGTILPCVPSITPEDTAFIDLPGVLFPTPTIKDPAAESSSGVTDPPIVTKLDDDEQLEAESLLSSSRDVKSCLNNNFTSPNILCSYIQTMLKFPLHSVCHRGDFVIVSTTIQNIETETSSEEILMSNEKQSEVTNSEIIPTFSDPGIEASATLDDTEAESVLPKDLATESNEITKQESVISEEVEFTEQTDKIPAENTEELQTTENLDTSSQIVLEPSTSDISINNDQSEISTEKLDVTATLSQSLGEQTQMESETSELPPPVTSQIQPDAISPTVTEASTGSQSSSESVAIPEKATPGIEIPIADEVMPTKHKYAGKPRELELVKVPLGSIAKRETAIMRLTNRIKALELNVSLSSRFLEELSKKFKKQNEEMMKLMNKTIARLNVTTRESEIRDLHQQRRIDVLEARMDNLTTLVASLSISMEALASKISDRQIVWSSVEFVMLTIVCVVCLFRGRSVNITPELKHLLETMPKQPNPNTNPRRNSISSIGHVPPATTIRKNVSMTALADQTLCDNKPPTIATDSDSHFVKDGHKKKKKRKKSIGSKSSMYIHETVDSDTSPVQISSEAGLLFGTDAGTSLSGVGLQEVDPGPQSQSSSSSTVSLPAQCHRRNFSDDIKHIQTTNEKKPVVFTKPILGRGQKSKKQSRNSIGGASDIKETLKSLNGKGSKSKEEPITTMTTASILNEPRHKSRVSWLF